MTDGASIADRLAAVRDRIAAAARAAGRAPGDVQLVAVTKTVPREGVEAALAAGQRVFGENRAQELVSKSVPLAGGAPAPVWHFVGRLQRNKVRSLAPHVACWQSVDRDELADELSRYAAGARVLVQVNIAAEPQKGGCDPESVPRLVERCKAVGLDVAGLMTVPPAGVDPRPFFASLRAMAQDLGLPELSMGMTGDYEVAVAEGATMVRVGSAIFGPRREGVGLRR